GNLRAAHPYFDLRQESLEKRSDRFVCQPGIFRQPLTKLWNAGFSIAKPDARPAPIKVAYCLVIRKAQSLTEFDNSLGRAEDRFGIAAPYFENRFPCPSVCQGRIMSYCDCPLDSRVD